MSFVLKILFITALVNIGLVATQSASELSFPGQLDLVTSLPNYTGDYSKIGHYAGYLKADERTYLYWFFKSRSTNWMNDPVVLWLNGGPGGSSLAGATYAFGTLVLHENCTLTRNPTNFSRSQKANLLFIETPVTVGFSYQHSSADHQTNDSQTVKHNLGAIKNFYEKFPHLVNSHLYLSGVSYASIFNLPLAVSLVEHKYPKNFKGVFISSGMFNDPVLAQMQHAHTVGLIDQYEWTQLTEACCPETFCSLRECPIFSYTYCSILFKNIDNDLSRRSLNWYNIYKKNAGQDATRHRVKWQNWFRNETVMKELHTRNHSNIWKFYNKDIFLNHLNEIPDVSHHVHQLLKSGIRILILNGDADLVTSYFNAKWLLQYLRDEFPKVLKSNSPLMFDGKLAGHKQQWQFTYYSYYLLSIWCKMSN